MEADVEEKRLKHEQWLADFLRRERGEVKNALKKHTLNHRSMATF